MCVDVDVDVGECVDVDVGECRCVWVCGCV